MTPTLHFHALHFHYSRPGRMASAGGHGCHSFGGTTFQAPRTMLYMLPSTYTSLLSLHWSTHVRGVHVYTRALAYGKHTTLVPVSSYQLVHKCTTTHRKALFAALPLQDHSGSSFIMAIHDYLCENTPLWQSQSTYQDLSCQATIHSTGTVQCRMRENYLFAQNNAKFYCGSTSNTH